jgi:peptidyl-prolyl cis-trans isomerase C
MKKYVVIMASAAAIHILVKTEKQALELKAKLAKGGDFGQLARKFSICPSKKKGGDLGEFRRGQMVKAFDDVVFKRELLKVHGPIRTKFGFHLIKTLYRN